jgi:hypothetical protein
MFAPIFAEQIEKLNSLAGTRLKVLAVPNTYFGGDVAVAGLLSGRDFLAVKDLDLPVLAQDLKDFERMILDGATQSAPAGENWRQNPRHRAAAEHPLAN